MRTFKENPYIGVFGETWAEKTVDIIKTSLFTNRVSVFEYDDREALFIDQYDYFIITDFGKEVGGSENQEWLNSLNQMREIICTRSMKSMIFANNDDPDISTSLREACCRVVKVNNLNWSKIPEIFATLVLCELCRTGNNATQSHHFYQIPVLKSVSTS